LEKQSEGKTVGSRGPEKSFREVHWSVGIIMQAVKGCPLDFVDLVQTRGERSAEMRRIDLCMSESQLGTWKLRG